MNCLTRDQTHRVWLISGVAARLISCEGREGGEGFFMDKIFRQEQCQFASFARNSRYLFDRLKTWADQKVAKMACDVSSMSPAKFAGRSVKLSRGISTSFAFVVAPVVAAGNKSFFGNNKQELANIVAHNSWRDHPTLAFIAHDFAQAKNMERKSLGQRR
jgi:hypothetical protein